MHQGKSWSLEFFDEKPSPTGLLLRLCKPTFGHRMIVTLDPDRGVLKALLKLKEHGLYVIDIIKSRRY